MNTTPKPGWRTTEFWVSLGALAVLLLTGTGVIDPTSSASLNDQIAKFATVAASVVSAGYALARAVVKAFHRP